MGRGKNGEVSRRQVRQVLSSYTRAYSLNGHHIDKEPTPTEAQAILDEFKRFIGSARAKDVPALALDHLPVPPYRIVVVFDKCNWQKQHDDANVVITITQDGTEVRWYDAVITTGKGCR